MLSTLHPKHLRSALTVPSSTAQLRCSPFGRTVSQHETGTHATDDEISEIEMEIQNNA